MLLQHGTELVLKRHLLVMLLLRSHILPDCIEIGVAYGKDCIACLPFEIGKFGSLFLKPKIGDSLQFFHPFRLRDFSSEAGQEVDVVFHSTDLNRDAVELFGDCTKIRM